MEHEPIFAENLSVAQATHRRGGIVIAQVERMTEAGTLKGKDVKVPGILVDYVVVEPDAWQSYVLEYDPAYAGEVRVPQGDMPVLPLDIRKVVARRAAMELRPNAVVNLGFGMANGIALVAAEEGIYQDVTLTVEQGLVGGIPALGNDAGLGPQLRRHDRYPVPVRLLRRRRPGHGLPLLRGGGPGGQREREQVPVRGHRPGRLHEHCPVRQEGVLPGQSHRGEAELSTDRRGDRGRRRRRVKKFVEKVQEITWSGPFALRRGQPARFITERAVFDLTPDGMMLIEVAEGIDIKRDVLDQIPFPVIVPQDVARWTRGMFAPEPMGIKDDPLRGRRRVEMGQFAYYAVENGIAVLTLDNPPVNANNLQMTREMGECLTELGANQDVRVVIVTGAGEKAFCAGSTSRSSSS